MMTLRIARRIQTPFVSSGGRSTFCLSSHSLSATIHRSAAVAAISRTYSQHQSFRESHHDTGVVTAVAASAAVGISLLGISSSSSQTLCDSVGDVKADGQEILEELFEDEPETEPEIDPYDNLPEEDEPTHCSICLTYRKGPCRPYWRKVEACTKDGEKEKKEEEEGVVGEDNGEKKDDESMSESTRCFKYMMPWIDCASRYRNLYTLIEMYTNYTEGIEELEATSRHFCWVPGEEPKINWSNWEQSSAEGQDNEAAKETNKSESDSDSTTEMNPDVPLWQTIDPAFGDPKLISIEATVPTTINSGLGILECAYAIDQDNNVIGFAYGTKPSDLITDEKSDDSNNNPNNKESKDSEKQEGGAETETSDENTNDKTKVTLNVRLVESRTESFVLSASYTHRIEGAQSSKDKPIALESHLYKSKPFVLANIPKLPTPASSPQENKHAE